MVIKRLLLQQHVLLETISLTLNLIAYLKGVAVWSFDLQSTLHNSL